MGRIAERIAELGLELPPRHPPVANYVGYIVSDNRIWVAGVGPTWGRELRFQGRIGAELDAAAGCAAARLTVLNLLAHADHALDGELDRVTSTAKLFALVRASGDGVDVAEVVDAGSALLAEILGSAGRHPRSLTQAPGLPVGIPIEMDAVFEFA